MAKYFLWYKINGTYCMVAWRYEISLLMLKQYFTASRKVTLPSLLDWYKSYLC